MAHTSHDLLSRLTGRSLKDAYAFYRISRISAGYEPPRAPRRGDRDDLRRKQHGKSLDCQHPSPVAHPPCAALLPSVTTTGRVPPEGDRWLSRPALMKVVICVTIGLRCQNAPTALDSHPLPPLYTGKPITA